MQAMRVKKSLGQHFLADDAIIGQIISLCKSLAGYGKIEEEEPHTAPSIMEIGPGRGALTNYLKDISDNLLLIEKDRDLVESWKAEGVKIIEADAAQTAAQAIFKVADA